MLTIDGGSIGIHELVAVARRGDAVSVSPAVPDRMRDSQHIVAGIDARDDVAYGVTTGFGALADRAVAPDQRQALQRALVLSHAAGMGAALDAEVVRGMLLLRARTLAAGYSGVRPDLVEAIAMLLNSGLVPWVPEHGSLGASGDLAALAHAAAALLGDGWFLADDGARLPAAQVLRDRGVAPLRLGPKEGLALINGTDASAAALALAVVDVEALLRAADCACAMSVEALLGTARPFAADVVALRSAPGQRASAANIAALLTGSPMVASHRESHHAVQDAYSLRCAPQVHGAARDAATFCRETVEREMASVVDNPVVLDGEVVSAGNFHAQAIAYAADLLAAVCADVAAISERRVDRLLDPARSRGLPAFLSPDPGLNSGFMIAQYTAAAMVASLRQAAGPLAVQSAVTSAGQEDHVSMSFEAARRTRASVPMLRGVLAVEVLCASQALELRTPLRPAPATAALVDAVRAVAPPLREDRVLAGDLAALEGWLRDEGCDAAVLATAGPLT